MATQIGSSTHRPTPGERIKRKKAQLDRYRPLPPDTVRRLNDDLRVFLTYHSNAIEGNTLSLRETQMAIEYGMTVHGHALREYLRQPTMQRPIAT